MEVEGDSCDGSDSSLFVSTLASVTFSVGMLPFICGWIITFDKKFLLYLPKNIIFKETIYHLILIIMFFTSFFKLWIAF